MPTKSTAYGYYLVDMPKAKSGTGPWGEAICAILTERGLTQADLVRLLNAEPFRKKHKCKKMQPKTVSRVTRGFPTQTRILELIAAALAVPLEAVLISPARQLSNEKRQEMARVVAGEVLRTLDARYGGETSDVQLVERIRRRGPRFLSDLEATLVSEEESERPAKTAKAKATKKAKATAVTLLANHNK